MEEVLPGNGGCTSSAILMRITAKEANNRMSLVKLPDGRYTQSGREALLELCRIHFLDSRLTDGSTDGQRQSDLGGHTSRQTGDWNQVRRMINQSKIK
jgi:hypothetical protein